MGYKENCRKNFPEITEAFSPYVKFQTLESGYTHYEKVPLKVFTHLIELNLINLEETQNNSPSISEFIKFAKEYNSENVTFHGYVIGPKREDCRVSIEGLEADTPSVLFREKFILFNRSADELETETILKSWWD